MEEIFVTCLACGDLICIAGTEKSSLDYIMNMRIDYYNRTGNIPSHIRYSKMCRKCNRLIYIDSL